MSAALASSRLERGTGKVGGCMYRLTSGETQGATFWGHTMELSRRKFLHLAAGAAALPAISRIAEAQSYPSRPITMIVPFPAGGPTDALARVLADPIRGSLGQPIIIENVSGADGSIGTGRAARARPDGYTIELGAI